MGTEQEACGWSRWFLPTFKLILAVGLGGVGGALFTFLGAPLPWMLGSIGFVTVACVLGLPVHAPSSVRPPMSAVIGVMLGTSFTTETLSHLSNWGLPLLALVAYLAISAVLCVWILHKIARMDLVTAFFSGMPGGLAEMVLIGEQYGANPRRVALVHSARIVIVVFSIPFLVQWIGGTPLTDYRAAGNASALVEIDGLGVLAALAVCGGLLGHFLKLPAKFLLGPMIVSSVAHLAGLTEATPPGFLVAGAQVVLGAAIASRFRGASMRELRGSLLISFFSTSFLIALALAAAFGVATISDTEPSEMLLALSPGGVAETGLIAIALGFEVAMIATMQIMRIFAVTLVAALFAKSGFGTRFLTPAANPLEERPR